MGDIGYFSLVRWRSDATRDEARNVAVILVEPEGQFGGVKAAPLSTVSPRLREQGLLDAMLVGLVERFAEETKPGIADLREMHRSLQHSIYLSEPQPVAVVDVDLALNALYKAFVAPRGGGSRAMTKGVVLDRVVNSLRKQGHRVRRGDYMGDFLFDVVIEGPKPSVAEVLSFATLRQNWAPVEYEAGHFLYALEQVNTTGLAVVQPPTETSHQNASRAYQRVMRWFDSADVRAIEPDELGNGQRAFEL